MQERDGHWEIARRWQAGDVVQLQLTLEPRLLTADGKSTTLAGLGADPVEAAAFLGPWLMAAGSSHEPLFFGEPWPGNTLQTGSAGKAKSKSPSQRPALSVPYSHDGFPGLQDVTLRRFCEASLDENALWSVWLRWKKG